jgi:lipopolysaccharide transport system ATP-binding protein
MSQSVIKVEDVSKLYRLGDIGTGSFGNDVKRWWASVRGKEDPFTLLAETNDRTQKGQSDLVWALKDVSFDVKQGEVLGVIGKNGAGKSTLLKLLSRTTLPTKGQIKIKGRIASLLEVGTGFHPDLTGRENVYLNGAILGMTKADIKKQFDEIVDFSGVERYIDTPVKRYSSGMYVRLAFGVAAHLEPEILIVDEVLAVGDYEFQKKCLGKMKDVSGHGRTILFVSHNTTALKSLCTKAAFLQNGMLMEVGSTNEVIDKYLTRQTSIALQKEWELNSAPGNDHVRITSARIIAEQGKEVIDINTAFSIEVEFHLNLESEASFFVGYFFKTLQDEAAFVAPSQVRMAGKGKFKYTCQVPAKLLNNKTYSLMLYFVRNRNETLFLAEDLLTFEVFDAVRGEGVYLGDYVGNVRPQLKWTIDEVSQ